MTSISPSFPEWSFIAGVILLQFGFVIREIGIVRVKDTRRIILRHLFNLLLSGVVYCLFGFIIAFSRGGDVDRIIGTTFVYPTKPVAYISILLQCTFASITSSIVSGAVAERCKLIAYFVYTLFITGFIHPVVRHWTLKNRGWLYKGSTRFQDYGGSGAIHVVGGIAALMGALMLGPRSNKDTANRCYSVRIAALGGFILLIGFSAFLWGCRLLFTFDYPNDRFAVSMANPVVSGFIAAFTALFINRYFGKNWSLLVAINGALTGLIAISAGSDDFEPYAAGIVGMIAAIVYRTYSTILVRLGIDDPLDVFAVHFGGGSWSLIAVAFFHKTTGILYAWNERSGLILLKQCIGLFAMMVWAAVLSAILFGMLRCFGILRICDKIEEKRFANPAYEILEIKNENLKTVDITVNDSEEKI